MREHTLNLGTVVSVRDGIYKVSGADYVCSGEMLVDSKGSVGVAISLEAMYTGVIMFSESDSIPGDLLFRLFDPLSLNVDFCRLGGVFNPMGDYLSQPPVLKFFDSLRLFDSFSPMFRAVEVKAPGIIVRESVKESLSTGVMGVDAAIPIGRGQRELIIGDRQTGKTSLAIDSLLNQAQVPTLYFKYLF